MQDDKRIARITAKSTAKEREVKNTVARKNSSGATQPVCKTRAIAV